MSTRFITDCMLLLLRAQLIRETRDVTHGALHRLFGDLQVCRLLVKVTL